MFSLDDERAIKLGEVISNPTAKKITNLLAEKEIYPEILPVEEDVKKVERRIKSENKKMLKGADKKKK